MPVLSRRGFLSGFAVGGLAAPAILKFDLLQVRWTGLTLPVACPDIIAGLSIEDWIRMKTAMLREAALLCGVPKNRLVIGLNEQNYV